MANWPSTSLFKNSYWFSTLSTEKSPNSCRIDHFSSCYDLPQKISLFSPLSLPLTHRADDGEFIQAMRGPRSHRAVQTSLQPTTQISTGTGYFLTQISSTTEESRQGVGVGRRENLLFKAELCTERQGYRWIPLSLLQLSTKFTNSQTKGYGSTKHNPKSFCSRHQTKHFNLQIKKQF